MIGVITGGLAAPFIGTAIGGAMGLSGIAATNAGLALLGGGSLASGGVDWTFVAALASVYLVPPVVAIYFFQKYLLVGMTFGTVRGEV